MPLTNVQIKAANATGKDLRLSDGHGLYIRVYKSGAKTWFFRYLRQGKDCSLPIGEYPGTSLQQARSLAAAQRNLLAQGVDPFDYRERQQQELERERLKREAAMTVADLAEVFYKRHILPTFKRPEEPRRVIDSYILPSIGNLPVESITRSQMAALLAELVDRNAAVMANRTLPILKRMFAYAVELGCIDESPAQLLTRKGAGGKEHSRSRYLSEHEIREVWRLLDDPAKLTRHSWQYRAAVKLLLLTGQRVGELLSATWNQIDLESREWVIPDTKAGRPHLVHLSHQAVDVLSALPSRSDAQGYVFPSTEQLLQPLTVRAVSQATRKLLQAGILTMPAWTPHDLRRTFVTHLAGLNIQPHVIEKMVNHTLEGVLAVYQRHDYLPERRQAFERWGNHLEVLTGDHSNVVQFPARTA